MFSSLYWLLKHFKSCYIYLGSSQSPFRFRLSWRVYFFLLLCLPFCSCFYPCLSFSLSFFFFANESLFLSSLVLLLVFLHLCSVLAKFRNRSCWHANWSQSQDDGELKQRVVGEIFAADRIGEFKFKTFQRIEAEDTWGWAQWLCTSRDPYNKQRTLTVGDRITVRLVSDFNCFGFCSFSSSYKYVWSNRIQFKLETIHPYSDPSPN